MAASLRSMRPVAKARSPTAWPDSSSALRTHSNGKHEGDIPLRLRDASSPQQSFVHVQTETSAGPSHYLTFAVPGRGSEQQAIGRRSRFIAIRRTAGIGAGAAGAASDLSHRPQAGYNDMARAPIDRTPLHVTLLPALGIAVWL